MVEMKSSANIVSLRKWKITKKYGKIFENYKYLFLILLIASLVTSIFMIDKLIMKKVLSEAGVDYNQYCETKIENSIDKKFRENYKKNLY